MRRKTICEVDFVRENGQQLLTIKANKVLEKLFASEEVKTSQIYKDEDGKGLTYYGLTPALKGYVKKYNDVAYRPVILENYGTDLQRDGRANLSILRTKGIANGIVVVVDGLILDNEVKDWVNSLAGYIKYLYANFVEKAEVKVSINMVV